MMAPAWIIGPSLPHTSPADTEPSTPTDLPAALPELRLGA